MVPHAPSLSIAGQVTVAAWFKPSTLAADWRPVVAKVQPDPEMSNYWLGHHGDQFWFIFKPDSTMGWVKPLASVSYPAGRWYHLVGVMDDSAGLLQLYVNGALFQATNISQKLVTETGSIWIGWAPGDDGIDGVIDEITIWNRRLSQAEVLTLYQQ